ncbi:lipoyl(octanoyl) transferase LipB [Candidatus Thalassolituus haligoni]|uniref:lipoyl(octanoyl) transferase LipB n=1 Tax=Candidatus Thalassolituus haligoni TaxID=3100113 RepID=UPI0035188E66
MPDVVVRRLGLVDYQPCYQQMVSFTAQRQPDTPDEIWLLQHPRVFTQGQAGKAEHLLVPGDIPVLQTDRGGQVTYHGPGQLVAYLLLDIKRLGIGPRLLVTAMEESIVATLAHWGIRSAAKADAPGVYVDGRKIASLGLRIRNGRTFHGLALNVDMDMTPFLRINPCGYAGLEMTQVVREVPDATLNIDQVAEQLEQQLVSHLGFATIKRPA